MYESCPIRKHSINCGNLLSFSKANTVILVTANLSDYLTFSNHYTALNGLVNKGGASESNELTISMCQTNLCTLHCIVMILIHTDTFNVQKVSTSVFQSKKYATCTFVEGTTAIGCKIRFVDTTGNTTAEKIYLPKPDGALSTIGCVEDLPPSVYRVMAYDIVSDGGTDDRVVAVGEALVTVTASTTGILHTMS